MHAQPVTTGLPAISAVHNATTAQPSSAIAAAVTAGTPGTPGIHQPSCGRWYDLPVELVEQVMYWSMLQSGSSRSATAFALTSTHFAQAGQGFRTSPGYREARSLLMHERTTSWTCSFVKKLGYLPFILSPGNSRELKLALKIMARTDEGMLHLLNIAHPLQAEPGIDHLDRFRSFKGPALCVAMDVLEQSSEQLIQVARVLPENVCLHVELGTPVYGPPDEGLGIASLVSRVAMSGRPSGFNLKRHADLSTRPDELGALLDVACGPGMISFLHFDRIDHPDAMLHALGDRCHRFRDLKLVMFNSERAPSRDALLALVAALEKRHAAAQLRLTVVIDCSAVYAAGAHAAPLFSADELAACEHAGLYVECLAYGKLNQEGMCKVLASLSRQTVLARLLQPNIVDAEPSSDSDVLTEPGDSEDGSLAAGDEPADDSPLQPAPQQQPAEQDPAEQASAPQVVKRDFCVIS